MTEKGCEGERRDEKRSRHRKIAAVDKSDCNLFKCVWFDRVQIQIPHQSARFHARPSQGNRRVDQGRRRKCLSRGGGGITQSPFILTKDMHVRNWNTLRANRLCHLVLPFNHVCRWQQLARLQRNSGSQTRKETKTCMAAGPGQQ